MLYVSVHIGTSITRYLTYWDSSNTKQVQNLALMLTLLKKIVSTTLHQHRFKKIVIKINTGTFLKLNPNCPHWLSKNRRGKNFSTSTCCITDVEMRWSTSIYLKPSLNGLRSYLLSQALTCSVYLSHRGWEERHHQASSWGAHNAHLLCASPPWHLQWRQLQGWGSVRWNRGNLTDLTKWIFLEREARMWNNPDHWRPCMMSRSMMWTWSSPSKLGRL